MLYQFNVNFKQLICKNLVFALIHFLPSSFCQLNHVYHPSSIFVNKDMTEEKRFRLKQTLI